MELGLLAIFLAACCGIVTLIGESMPHDPPRHEEKKARFPYPEEL